MDQFRVLSRVAVTVMCLACFGFSVGMCSDSDPLIQTVVSNEDLPYSAKLNTVQNITESEWDSLVMMSELPVLVMFTSDQCKRCSMMDRILEQEDSIYAGKLNFYKIDINKAPVIAERYYVRDLPTIIFFRGGWLEDQVIGFNPAKVLRLVDKYAH
ncbi:PREDICTED: thioredoxin M4, chloroplastic-like [Camelina sativa]|uniref:Thioredoxin M4, chloroplastic-like n=1 Tax=Camelina sativa TaxID=90675 RepID=A0ABM0W8Y5_CAMSA|nr:PREDICTED: thioredoxin M4, chloroplastic-like [Camelina sativa]